MTFEYALYEIVTIRLEIIRKDILKNRIKAKKAKVQLLNEENYPEINFDKFKSIPLLTETDIANEEKRLKEIENKLIKAWEEVSSFEDKVKNTMVLTRFD